MDDYWTHYYHAHNPSIRLNPEGTLLKKLLLTTLSILLIPLTAYALIALPPNQGGTGVGTTPNYGQLLVGNSSNGYTLTATSSLGIISGTNNPSFSTTSANYWLISTSSPLFVGSITATSTTATSTFNGFVNFTPTVNANNDSPTVEIGVARTTPPTSGSLAGGAYKNMYTQVGEDGGTGMFSSGQISGGGSFFQAQDANNAGTYYKVLLNPLGGDVAVNTYSPSTALDVNGDITDENVKSASLISTNGTGTFTATGTPQLTVGNLLATTTATSTFIGPVVIGSGTTGTSTLTIGVAGLKKSCINFVTFNGTTWATSSMYMEGAVIYGEANACK